MISKKYQAELNENEKTWFLPVFGLRTHLWGSANHRWGENGYFCVKSIVPQ